MSMYKRDTIRLSDTDDVADYCITVDIAGIEFSEETTQWIQAMPMGKYSHPLHGEINITADRVRRFADNVNNNVRGQQLDIDYEHKGDPSKGTEASGWVKEARSVSIGPKEKQGLWLLVEWVKDAAEAIKDKKFRYFSPEFQKTWEHPKSGVKFNDVLFGGALTNRPFLKGILPIELTETEESEGNSIMNRKALEALAKKNGIEFDSDTSDDDLSSKVEEAASAEDFNTESDESGSGDSTDTDNQEEEEVSEELALLTESNPIVAGLVAKLTEQNTRMAALEAGAKIANASVKLSELDSDNAILSPKVKQQLSDLMISTDEKTADKVFDLAKSILDGGIVELGERGGKPDSLDLGGKTAAQVFNDEVTKLTEGDKGISYSDASVKLSGERPELWNAYQEEVFSGGSK